MKRNYKIDFVANTLTVSKEFEKNVMDTASEEYKILLQLRSDFPTLRIVKKATPKRKKCATRLTYAKMKKYIECQCDSQALIKQFEAICNLSKSQKNCYEFVRGWFLETFKDYGKYPTIEKKTA